VGPEGAHDGIALLEQRESDPIVGNQGGEALIDVVQNLFDPQSLVDPLRDLRQHRRLLGLRLQRLGESLQSLPELGDLVGCSDGETDIVQSAAKGLRGLSIQGNSGVVHSSSGWWLPELGLAHGS